MGTSKILLIAIAFCLYGFPCCKGYLEFCSALYERFGGRDVRSYPDCRQSSPLKDHEALVNCAFWGSATVERHEGSHNDSLLFCDLNLTVPFYGRNNSGYSVGMKILFGGGDDNDERTLKSYWELTKELFLIHAYFLQNGKHGSEKYKQLPELARQISPAYYLQNGEIYKQVPGELAQQISQLKRNGSASANSDPVLKLILKEAVLKTVRDVSIANVVKNYTAAVVCPVIVVVFKGQVLVVEACDARAFLCRGQPPVPPFGAASFQSAEVDYLPPWGAYAPLSPLQYTHKMADLIRSKDFKLSVTDWRSLTEDDWHLVSSGGIFEWLTRQDACVKWQLL